MRSSVPLYVQAGSVAETLVEQTGRATIADVMRETPCGRSTARTGLWRAWNQHWPDWHITEGEPLLVLSDRKGRPNE